MTTSIAQNRLLHLLAGGRAEWIESTAADDADLVAAQAVARDPQQFLQIYERHYERILNYLYRRSGDRELAADLASRTFLNALQFLQTRSVRRLQVRPWLYRIATTMHLQHLRSQRRWLIRIPLLGTQRLQVSTDAFDSLVASSEHRELLRHLHSLPDTYRTPLLLRFYEELSYREIGATLGIAEPSARSRVGRGLDKLARAMEQEP